MGDFQDVMRMVAALVFVVSLMGGLALILKRFGLAGHVHMNSKQARLKVIESLPLDGRRRLALVQRDDVQHLVILGPTSETVIETGIKPKDNDGHV